MKNATGILAAMVLAGSGIAPAFGASPDGEWTGQIHCSPLRGDPVRSPAFSNPISMLVNGKNVSATRDTSVVYEALTGKLAANGYASLAGEGRFKSGNRQPWTMKIEGQFASTRFNGRGEVFISDGTRVRDCTVELAQVVIAQPRVAQRSETKPAVVVATTQQPLSKQDKVQSLISDRITTQPSQYGQQRLVVLGKPTDHEGVSFDIDLAWKIESDDKQAQIVGIHSGGNACPVLYVAVFTESGLDPLISKPFGPCSDDPPKIKRSSNQLTVELPTPSGRSTLVVLTIQNLSIDGKPIIENRISFESNKNTSATDSTGFNANSKIDAMSGNQKESIANSSSTTADLQSAPMPPASIAVNLQAASTPGVRSEVTQSVGIGENVKPNPEVTPTLKQTFFVNQISDNYRLFLISLLATAIGIFVWLCRKSIFKTSNSVKTDNSKVELVNKCNKCGTKLQAKSAFCSACGNSVKLIPDAKQPEKISENSADLGKRLQKSYRVVLDGNCLSGFEYDKVKSELVRITRQTEFISSRLLSGNATTIKSGVDQSVGERYLSTLREIGVSCQLVEESVVIDPTINFNQVQPVSNNIASTEKFVISDSSSKPTIKSQPSFARLSLLKFLPQGKDFAKWLGIGLLVLVIFGICWFVLQSNDRVPKTYIGVAVVLIGITVWLVQNKWLKTRPMAGFPIPTSTFTTKTSNSILPRSKSGFFHNAKNVFYVALSIFFIIGLVLRLISLGVDGTNNASSSSNQVASSNSNQISPASSEPSTSSTAQAGSNLTANETKNIVSAVSILRCLSKISGNSAIYFLTYFSDGTFMDILYIKYDKDGKEDAQWIQASQTIGNYIKTDDVYRRVETKYRLFGVSSWSDLDVEVTDKVTNKSNNTVFVKTFKIVANGVEKKYDVDADTVNKNCEQWANNLEIKNAFFHEREDIPPEYFKLHTKIDEPGKSSLPATSSQEYSNDVKEAAEKSIRRLAQANDSLIENNCKPGSIEFQNDRFLGAAKMYREGVDFERRFGATHQTTRALFDSAKRSADAGFVISERMLKDIKHYCP